MSETNPSEGKVLTFVNRGVNMQLVRIAREQWDVLAVLGDRGECQVLDFLTGPSAAQRSMLRLLRSQLPAEGPPRSVEFCKALGDGIFELRRQPKGPKLRVLFFYDDGCRIVCTNAFRKAERTPRTEVRLARDLKRQYFSAKRLRRLRIEEESADG
ncbi:MAG TPA: type II toxin-antitoxin system RelE/ParE family toxin [Thermoanaerobaculia bacterium]|nr:type II toxin-antitoxin system RelE/ParE family toxin [Thermoanaerobaculia bacterium]